MAQRKPEEKASLDQVLKLADQLTPTEQEQLVEQMKLQWLRRALDEGEESLRRDGGIPAAEVFAELQQRAEERLRKKPAVKLHSSKSNSEWFLRILSLLIVAILLSSYKLDCLAKSCRYRLTIQVEKNGEIHSGSSVIELNTIWTGFLFGIDNTQKFETHARGEAVFVDLGEGDNLIALLDDEPYWKSTRMLPAFVILGDETARKQSPYFDPLTSTFPEKLRDAKDKVYTVRPDQLPTLVRFRNLGDQTTIEEVDPTNFSMSYGDDVVLREISLSITQDPVSEKISNEIPWLYQLTLSNSHSRMVLKRHLINKRTGKTTDYNSPVTYNNFVRK